MEFCLQFFRTYPLAYCVLQVFNDFFRFPVFVDDRAFLAPQSWRHGTHSLARSGERVTISILRRNWQKFNYDDGLAGTGFSNDVVKSIDAAYDGEFEW